MRIEHLALWSKDIERLRAFYQEYFGARCGERYENERTGFSSYFLSFGKGCRLELMQRREPLGSAAAEVRAGLAHFAVSTDSKAAVEALTERLRRDGHPVLGEPRTTGDGYYESVVADPDGNRIEITV